eukprot:13641579-Alexandrium_andersonii.AAC.1
MREETWSKAAGKLEQRSGALRGAGGPCGSRALLELPLRHGSSFSCAYLPAGAGVWQASRPLSRHGVPPVRLGSALGCLGPGRV